MKKRVGYIMMFLVALLLGGCNLFSGLDKEDLNAPGAFEFKLDDAMANGEYTVVVGLIDSKIASSPTLKAVDDEIGANFTSITSITSTTSITDLETIFSTLTTYLNTNISKPEVKEYIELKVSQAEAYLGQSGLKMTDIVANITDSTSGNVSGSLSKNISKNTSVNNFNISKLIPSGLDSVKLQLAIDSYLKSLPTTTGAAFDVIKNEQQLAYLNAALSSAINAVNRFINVYKDTAQPGIVLVSSSTAFSGTYPTEWAKQLPRIRAELKTALMFINCYSATGNSLISNADRDKLNADFGKLIAELESFDADAYVEFTSQAGISIGQ